MLGDSPGPGDHPRAGEGGHHRPSSSRRQQRQETHQDQVDLQRGQ